MKIQGLATLQPLPYESQHLQDSSFVDTLMKIHRSSLDFAKIPCRFMKMQEIFAQTAFKCRRSQLKLGRMIRPVAKLSLRVALWYDARTARRTLNEEVLSARSFAHGAGGMG
jgi:hypothetical protein